MTQPGEVMEELTQKTQAEQARDELKVCEDNQDDPRDNAVECFEFDYNGGRQGGWIFPDGS
jgi:hypothetical protein